MKTVIGIDFDNTIVCYQDVFYEVALEQGLISKDFPKNKEKIRDYLRSQNQEEKWTEMQGYVYGQRMEEAQPFPGIAEFITMALSKGLMLYIISHKTRYPYAGPKYDLHQSALTWLKQQDFFGLAPTQAFFLETKQAKCQKIQALHCTHFIDDLPELLLDSAFPTQVEKLLFTPEGVDNQHLEIFKSWPDIQNYFFGLTSP